MIYAAAFYLWNILAVLTLGWGLLLPRRYVLPLASFWAQGHLAVMRWTLGLRYEVEGLEHLPDGPVIVAAKHQSAWETIAFNAVFRQPAFVLKRELFRIPGIGWWLWRAGNIGIDRRAGASALKAAVRGARARLAEGRPVVIFPEGTRTAPGARRRYQPGVAAIYAETGAPILPVAHNAGLFWPPKGLPRRGGVITVSILPAIPPGLERKAMMAKLETAIETRADALARRPSFALAAYYFDKVFVGAVEHGRPAALRARDGVGAAIAFGEQREVHVDALMDALAEGLDAGAAMARIAATVPRDHNGVLAAVDAAGRTADLHGTGAPAVTAAASRRACVALVDGGESARLASTLTAVFSRSKGGGVAKLRAALGAEARVIGDPPI